MRQHAQSEGRLLARYAVPREAQAAMKHLELHGIEGGAIRFVKPDEGSVRRRARVREARLIGTVGKRVLAGWVVGAILGGALGLGLGAWLLSGAGIWVAGVAGGIAGWLVGGFAAGITGLQMGESFERSFESGSSSLVEVHGDPDLVRKAEELLRETEPLELAAPRHAA